MSLSTDRVEKGLILFGHTKEAFLAEAALKKEGFAVKSVLPPRDIITGCDVAVEININERLAVERTLKVLGKKYSRIISIQSSERELMALVKKVDFGDTIMYRCAAMKLTIDKNDGTIVNISGGGCPDVPYLFIELVGRRITEVKRPGEIGYSLCSYSLDKAYEEALKAYETGGCRDNTD
jgi:hypothetical protein